jgi:hypothetical protein
MRYSIARLLYRLRFPTGGLSICDFRPHFDGYAVNTHVVIAPQRIPSDTRAVAYKRLVQMVRGLRVLHLFFADGDRIQMVVGFRNPPTQLLKGWLPAKRLNEADPMNLAAIGGAMQEMAQWSELKTTK